MPNVNVTLIFMYAGCVVEEKLLKQCFLITETPVS